MKKRVLVLCTAFLCTGVMPGCGSDQADGPEKEETPNADHVVMYLDGDAVTEEEYALIAAENRNQITMQYTTDQVNGEDFWQTEIDGAVPCSQLEELVLEDLKYDYAVKHLAVEAGVTEDYTYEDLLDNMESGNQERADQLAEEEVVYGLTEYDEAAYYNYWYSNLETQWKNEWIQGEADVGETDCREYYEEHAEDFTYETSVRILYAEFSYRSEEDYGEAQHWGLSLSRAMEASEDLEEIKEAFPEAEFRELELNDFDTQEGMSGAYLQRWEYASQLEEGQVCGPYEDHGRICVMKCISRTENGTLEFDDVKDRIERMLQVEAADRCIQETADSMKVESGKISAESVIMKTVSD